MGKSMNRTLEVQWRLSSNRKGVWNGNKGYGFNCQGNRDSSCYGVQQLRWCIFTQRLVMTLDNGRGKLNELHSMFCYEALWLFVISMLFFGINSYCINPIWWHHCLYYTCIWTSLCVFFFLCCDVIISVCMIPVH